MAGVLAEAGPLSRHGAQFSGWAIGTYLESKAPCVAHDPSVGALAVMENIFHF